MRALLAAALLTAVVVVPAQAAPKGCASLTDPSGDVQPTGTGQSTPADDRLTDDTYDLVGGKAWASAGYLHAVLQLKGTRFPEPGPQARGHDWIAQVRTPDGFVLLDLIEKDGYFEYRGGWLPGDTGSGVVEEAAGLTGKLDVSTHTIRMQVPLASFEGRTATGKGTRWGGVSLQSYVLYDGPAGEVAPVPGAQGVTIGPGGLATWVDGADSDAAVVIGRSC